MAADYPHFDGTQACHRAPETATQAFAGLPGADPSAALQLCADCGFLQACRAFALTHDTHGVWGGTTDLDRNQMRKATHQPRPPLISDELDELILTWRRHATAAAEPWKEAS